MWILVEGSTSNNYSTNISLIPVLFKISVLTLDGPNKGKRGLSPASLRYGLLRKSSLDRISLVAFPNIESFKANRIGTKV